MLGAGEQLNEVRTGPRLRSAQCSVLAPAARGVRLVSRPDRPQMCHSSLLLNDTHCVCALGHGVIAVDFDF
jgi:hypothetical protein